MNDSVYRQKMQVCISTMLCRPIVNIFVILPRFKQILLYKTKYSNFLFPVTYYTLLFTFTHILDQRLIPLHVVTEILLRLSSAYLQRSFVCSITSFDRFIYRHELKYALMLNTGYFVVPTGHTIQPLFIVTAF